MVLPLQTILQSLNWLYLRHHLADVIIALHHLDLSNIPANVFAATAIIWCPALHCLLHRQIQPIVYTPTAAVLTPRLIFPQPPRWVPFLALTATTKLISWESIGKPSISHWRLLGAPHLLLIGLVILLMLHWHLMSGHFLLWQRAPGILDRVEMGFSIRVIMEWLYLQWGIKWEWNETVMNGWVMNICMNTITFICLSFLPCKKKKEKIFFPSSILNPSNIHTRLNYPSKNDLVLFFTFVRKIFFCDPWFSWAYVQCQCQLFPHCHFYSVSFRGGDVFDILPLDNFLRLFLIATTFNGWANLVFILLSLFIHIFPLSCVYFFHFILSHKKYKIQRDIDLYLRFLCYLLLYIVK